MAGLSYTNTELRKLPPSFRLKIAQFLDVNDSWKRLMASIPADLTNPSRSKPKYTMEHIELIERHARTTNASNSRLCSEILLDEWSTSGKVRPTVETLYYLVQKCQLFRVADYIASEILDTALPERPREGPARIIPLLSEREAEVIDDQHDLTEENDVFDHVGPETDPNLNAVLQELNNYDHFNGNIINFKIEILEKATNNFHETYSIGSGAFGTVYVLNFQANIPKLAVKLLNTTTALAEEQFLTEINVLSTYRHENLLSLIGFSTSAPRYCLVYEFMPNGSLLEAISSHQDGNLVLDWFRRISILHGVAKGINYLHTGQDKPLVHRDIKSANVLLSAQYVAKIGDFGLAKSLSGTNQTSALTSTIFGSSAYMSPEAFRGDISPKIDIFSFGVIIMEVLTGFPPYDEQREGNDIVTYLEEIVENDYIVPFLDERAGTIPETYASQIYSIGLNCLAEKKRRPTAQQLVNDFLPLTVRFSDKNCL